MIRRTFILSILLLVLISCQAQKKNYFEGTVTYHFDIITKNTRLDSAKMKLVLGTGSTLTFKEGNYYHRYDGGIMEFDMYNKSDNKMYFKRRNNDTIFWHDCALLGDKIDKFEFTTKKVDVLGINCDELIIHYSNKIVSHYYNASSLGLNPDWFKKFTLNGENLIDEKERAIYLKSKVDYSAFLIIETATKISRKNINSKVFELPANSILVEQ